MDRKILVQTRSSYGTDYTYVVSEHAQAISGLTKKKTVDSRDMELLAALGFVVEQVPLLIPVS